MNTGVCTASSLWPGVCTAGSLWPVSVCVSGVYVSGWALELPVNTFYLSSFSPCIFVSRSLALSLSSSLSLLSLPLIPFCALSLSMSLFHCLRILCTGLQRHTHLWTNAQIHTYTHACTRVRTCTHPPLHTRTHSHTHAHTHALLWLAITEQPVGRGGGEMISHD